MGANVARARAVGPCLNEGMRWGLALSLLCACQSPAADAPAPAPSSSSSVASPDAAAADAAPAHRASEALLRCAKEAGELSSIADTIVRLNALEAPADGPCFVATLPRPVAVVATIGATSAQPAAGASSPRLFLLLPKLVVSVVPAGEGSKLLELGEWVTSTRTLKGEVSLPVTAPLAPDAAFRRVFVGPGGSVCATCHRNEAAHPSIADAFVSAAFKPALGTFVTVAELRTLHDVCTRDDDPSERCAMFHALFDFGEVRQGAFASEVETFNP